MISVTALSSPPTPVSALCEDWLMMWAALARLLACPALLQQGEVLERLLCDVVLHGLWTFLTPTVTAVTAGSGERTEWGFVLGNLNYSTFCIVAVACSVCPTPCCPAFQPLSSAPLKQLLT